MTSVLFISRTRNGVGGMQTYVAVLHRALRDEHGLTVTPCMYRGGIAGLPLFLLRAAFAVCRFRGDRILLTDAVLSPLVLLRPRCTAVVTHGLDVVKHLPGYSAVVGWFLRRAECVIAVSRATGELVRALGVQSSRLRIIPCPLPDTSAFPAVRHPGQILLLGRLVPRKGVAWFLQSVLPVIAVDRSDLTFIIAGTGPDAPGISRILVSSPFRDRVRIAGCVSDDEKAQLLSSSTLLLVPNVPRPHDPEGFGIVCIEAAAAGLPVVAARTGGIPDAVKEGVTGLLFHPRDVEDCRRAVIDALAMHWDGNVLRETVREQFSSARIARRFIHEVF